MIVPPKKVRCKVPEHIKIQVEQKAENLIQSVLKPEHIKTPQEKGEF